MINERWTRDLASDIIRINCLNCREFIKSPTESDCWCIGVEAIVDFEIYREYHKIEQEFEDQVAGAWEEERERILGDNE
jgi:hypothetical protein